MGTWSYTTDKGISPASRRRLEEAIDVASRLVGTDDIGAVHVTIAERPTYDDLRLFRQIAACHGLSLTMRADCIVLRPKPIDPAIAGHSPALGVAALLPEVRSVAVYVWHRVHSRRLATPGVRSGPRWLHDHATSWNAGFQGLSEGTR